MADKGKQIEEMENDILQAKNKRMDECWETPCEECKHIGKDYCTTCGLAEILIEQGYRKEIQGEWEMVKYPLTKCSNCDVVRNCEIDTGWKYCPNCGAKMKGAE